MKRIISWLCYPGIAVLMITVGALALSGFESGRFSVDFAFFLNVSFFSVFFFSWICSGRSKAMFRLFFLIGVIYFAISLGSGMCVGFATFSLLALVFLHREKNIVRKTKKDRTFHSNPGIKHVLKQDENRVTGTVIAIFENKSNKHTVHIPFCPPFDSTPGVEFTQEIMERVSVKQLFITCYGMRFELKIRDDVTYRNEPIRIRFRVEIDQNNMT